jgi:hypothetical protein
VRILFGLVVFVFLLVLWWPLGIVGGFGMLILFGRGEEKRRARRIEQQKRLYGVPPDGPAT